ncbi:MAG: GH92 family glycosyl hydrolase [Clostridia bacterium]|nr:GH92 family glycosyl hydrolase [Clostridia bacterium]
MTKSKAKYIDPMIGTVGDEQSESTHGGGKTYPGACVPGGMVQLSPDTVTGGDNGTGYNYCHNTIEGFSFNHMSGIGWYGDLGNMQVMPVVGETDLRSGSNAEVPFEKGKTGWKSPFTHERENARAGYYSVHLDRYGIFAEATVSARTGMLRFTYPETDDARIIFNISRRIGGKADFEHVEIIGNNRIEGSVHCTPKGGGFGRGGGGISYDFYFACEFSVPAEKLCFFSNEEMMVENLTSFEHEDIGVLAYFGKQTRPVLVKCGISYTDLEGARKNLAAESQNFDFDAMAEKAFAEWEKAFEKVEVSGSDETDMKIFHTCLYHVLLDPRCAADVDGRFRIGDKILKEKYTHRTVFSGWDVYRSEFPLLTLINPETVNDEVNSLIKIAEIKNTSLPQWELLGIDSHSMVGDPGLIVCADAYVKGIRGYDADKLYEIAKASSLSSKELFGKPFHSVRPDCEQYTRDAYVPKKISNTLEFLLADYTMSRFAKAMNKTEDAEHFKKRAMRYGENFNKRRGFMVPRKETGKFVFITGRYYDNYCVESNIFQQSWFVPYDVIGLSKLFGKKRTVRLLETFFKKADFSKLWNEDYNHSNEPCHNITHYFNMLGLAHRTQYWTRRVQKEAYRTGAFGFCGNEDVGQLSAWYVLSAIGFAQLCPAYEGYFLNTPLFKTAKITLDEKYHSCSVAKTFSVECDKDPLEYPYIRSAKLNGKLIDRPYLTYSEITAGGTLALELSKEPCEDFGKNVSLSFTD